MNDLNSVLIEGVLTKDLDIESVDGKVTHTIRICSNRYLKEDKEVSYIDVYLSSDVKRDVLPLLKKDRKVRCIGRLKQDCSNGQNKIVIIADHIECKFNKEMD